MKNLFYQFNFKIIFFINLLILALLSTYILFSYGIDVIILGLGLSLFLLQYIFISRLKKEKILSQLVLGLSKDICAGNLENRIINIPRGLDQSQTA